jgi:hypothetical protein
MAVANPTILKTTITTIIETATNIAMETATKITMITMETAARITITTIETGDITGIMMITIEKDVSCGVHQHMEKAITPGERFNRLIEY